MEDSRIVELYFVRDESAIVYTAEKYSSRLRSLSYSIVRDGQICEECENDTYVQAWETIPPNCPKDYFYPFLARIIRNISLNRCRYSKRLKRDAAITEIAGELEGCLKSTDDIECKISDMEFAEMLNGFLQSLKEESRKIFIRRYFFADSEKVISERYKISESKVKASLFRSRSRLREFLLKEGYDL